MRSSLLGKYRLLVLAVAAFFALSVSVYSLNFLMLRQVDLDATRINDGGKLRGYSQQLAKAILTLSHESSQGEPIQTSQAQISEAVLAFDQSLTEIRSLASEDHDPTEQQLLDEIDKQWTPLRDAANALIGERPFSETDVQATFTLSDTRNVRLLQLAGDLTQHQEALAAERAQSMRYLQFGAIGLALLNFLYIVVHVFRSLRRSDREAEQARRETDDILRTVREGLFLMHRDGTVGTQRSAHLAKVFPQPLAPGHNFLTMLATLVSDETMQSVRQYVELLFNERVKPALLADLNPLNRVEIAPQGRGRTMHLNFGFHPVRGEGGTGIDALLVAAVDVSQEVRLEQELAGAEERARNEVSLLLGVLENEPAEVMRFLAEAKARLERANGVLRDVPVEVGAYLAAVTRVFREVHTIKGEAAALSMGTVAAQAHEFEDVLTALVKRRNLGGDDLIPVATGIGHLMQELAKVDAVVGRIGAFTRVAPGRDTSAADVAGKDASADDCVYQSMQRIQRFALSVAAELNKKLRVETSLPHVEDVPASVHRVLREGLPQLVRNAVVHGIESADERRLAGKQEEGRLRIEFQRTADGGLELTVADDGRGIDVAALRRHLVDAGYRDADAVQAMSDREVVATLFEPGVSTAASVTEHAGRGVGLDAISALARETGARLKLASTPRTYTRFTLQWSPT
ncbi:ATP-binding protein [Azoarcus sp. KH32C]|uniref:ATP-binding protein n=1 Tax=Azoarcus sp. KH32C TaxID=748247 RepID=UPI00155AD84E|nr:ATP-binding protein [Azoarcus sp. KH32C]